ncbi:MAG: hypothetical protein LBQ42_05805 [Synergistaceae bacterium]|nr:hypothetical protein [Synergistaceae bacterium]
MPNSQESNTQEKDAQNFLTPPEENPGSPATPPNETAQLYGALKCYFYTPKRGDIWGAFCFLFNGTTGETMENVFWVTRMLVGPPIDVNMGWRELNKAIPSMGVYEKAMGDKLINSMLEIFSPSARIELSQSADASARLGSLSTGIRNSFERTTHYFLELKMAFEHLSRQDMINAGVLPKEGEEAKAPDNPAAEKHEKSFAGTLITCLPVIDPVRGTPVSELTPGDVLEVKIQGGIGAGELIQQYLNSTNQDAAFPVLTVEKKDDDKTYVVLEINEEVKGLITVSKDLRLRTLQRVPLQKKTIAINVDNLIFFGTLIAAAIVILFVIRFLFF